MYNAQGHKKNTSNAANQFVSWNTPVSVRGFRIKPLYLVIGGLILLLIASYLAVQFLNTGLIIHFGLLAGIVLLLANVRVLRTQSYTQPQRATAFLNSLVGGALVCAWLSQIVGVLFWVPAIVLLGGAAPLALGQTHVYAFYEDTFYRAVAGIRQIITR